MIDQNNKFNNIKNPELKINKKNNDNDLDFNLKF